MSILPGVLFVVLPALIAASHDNFTLVTAKIGDNVTLPCVIPDEDAAFMVNVTLLEWFRDYTKYHGYVYFYRNRKPYANYHHPLYSGRVTHFKSIRTGNASIVLTNVQLSDCGDYRCRMIYDNAHSRNEVTRLVRLNVLEADPGSLNEPISGGWTKSDILSHWLWMWLWLNGIYKLL